ncbi:MAG TPA: hypothetical protein VF407_15265, partial [Polyangiaceae bacterium]
MRKARSLPLLLTLIGSGLLATVHIGCGSTDDGSSFPPDGGQGGDTDGNGVTYDSGGGFGGDGSTGPHSDFPANPIIDAPDGGTGGAPANAPALFAGATATDAGADAPCLEQTEVGSLLPRNWLRPRFGWDAGGGENLFEIRVHADNQVNDLVVYTANKQWTMPADMWKNLARDSAGVPMTVSVRGAVFDGTNITSLAQGSSGPFGIAPVDAPGAIVYWHILSDGSSGELKGFSIGDEDVQLALGPTQTKQYSTTCVGCHVSTPDGNFAVYSSPNASYSWGDGVGALSGADAGVGSTPSFLTNDGKTALQTDLIGIMTTSIAHWSTGDHMVIAGSQDNTTLRWANLDGTGAAATGVLPITGDPNANRSAPQWSHDGQHVVYTSAPQAASGRPSGSGNDIYIAPYNNRAGGAAVALANANTADNEYYPSYSPDDKWVVFNRTKDSDTYSVAGSEVYVAKADGSGTATRLAANDPPACSSRKSPGQTNSWPRWAPAKPSPQTVNGLTYYWVVFSSKRFDGSTPQLYMAPVVVDASGNVQQYQGVYLWNQPAAEKNHTPAWDSFAIP